MSTHGYNLGMKTIEALRRERGWTQRTLGAMVGVSGQAVYNWERGAKLPSAITLRKLAEAFGVSMDDLDFEAPARAKDGGGE